MGGEWYICVKPMCQHVSQRVCQTYVSNLCVNMWVNMYVKPMCQRVGQTYVSTCGSTCKSACESTCKMGGGMKLHFNAIRAVFCGSLTGDFLRATGHEKRYRRSTLIIVEPSHSIKVEKTQIV